MKSLPFHLPLLVTVLFLGTIRSGFARLLTSLFFTAIGSSYYHLAPRAALLVARLVRRLQQSGAAKSVCQGSFIHHSPSDSSC
jgi:hypothetical protein